MEQRVKICLLPMDSEKRIGEMIPKWITIHETSLGLQKEIPIKNAKHYSNILNSSNSTVGYHFLIEANFYQIPTVYQFLETNVSTHHTGSIRGNNESIGIERLVNIITNFEVAILLQAKLTATIMEMYNLSIESVVPHKYWSGKECPARLLSGQYGGWKGFIDKVVYFYNNGEFIEGIK